MGDVIKRYGKIYRKVLKESGIDEVESMVSSYERRLGEMYESEDFKGFNVYPSTNVTHVYAVIAMCLEIQELGFEGSKDH